MKRLFLLASLMLFAACLVGPICKRLNRQTPINPNTVESSLGTSQAMAQFHGVKLLTPSYVENKVVLAATSNKKKDKHIEIDLTNQKLYAFEGDKKVHSFLVSTGKWYPTPTGEFHIWTKIRYALMTGGSKALNTYYYLPNVPYTMYFYGSGIPKTAGFGIHGAYWHSNFGHPMSHGCVNMKTEEAEVIFDWATSENDDGTGTKIIIYGTAPQE